MAVMQAMYAGTCKVCGKRFGAGATIEYDRATKSARHVDCKPFVAPAGAIWVSQGEGYGGMPYKSGSVIPNPKQGEPPYLFVLHATREYFREDGYSFGVGDESGYIYHACCRVATDEESADLRDREAQAAARQQAETQVVVLIKRIRQEGAFAPQGTPFPDGEHVFDTQNIHGSGAVFVLSDTGVWYLSRHTMDGDDWSANNVAGLYQGWFIADPAVADQLRALKEVVA